MFCICRQPYDARRFMIGCDMCNDWFHARCVNITVAEAERIKNFVCPPCRAKQNKGGRKTARKTMPHFQDRRHGSGSRKYGGRRGRHSNFEVNFDTSESESAEERKEPSSDEDADPTAALENKTPTVDVHSYSITKEDLGANVDWATDEQGSRDLLVHLRKRELAIQQDLIAVLTRKQVMAAGMGFAERESSRRRTENELKEKSRDPNDDNVEFHRRKMSGMYEAFETEEELRETEDFNIQCRVSGAYIPVDLFGIHTLECSRESALTRFKANQQSMRMKPIICGCPLLNAESETLLQEPPKPAPLKQEAKGEPVDRTPAEGEEKAPKDEANNMETEQQGVVEGAVAPMQVDAVVSDANAGEKQLEQPASTPSPEAERTTGADGAEGAADSANGDSRDMASAAQDGKDAGAIPNEIRPPPAEGPNPGAADAADAASAGAGLTAPAAVPQLQRPRRSRRGIKRALEDKPPERTAKRTRQQIKRAEVQESFRKMVGYTLHPANTRGALDASYSGYCTKTTSECKEHAGWAALWRVECAQLELFYQRRLQLIRDEIIAVRQADQQRRNEIERAKQKAEREAKQKERDAALAAERNGGNAFGGQMEPRRVQGMGY